MKTVFQFENSTVFFADRFRGRGPAAVHSRRLGYSSPRLLEMVCKGDRLASDDFIFRAKSVLKLTDQEFLYLGLLVRRDRDRNRGRENPQVNAEIANFSRLALDQKFVDEQMFRLISDWPHFVLKQYFRKARKLNLEKISKALKGKVSPAQVNRVLKTLSELGIVYVSDGEIRPRLTAGFVSQTDIPSQAIRAHHRQMMERALEALEEVPVREREIVSLTLSFESKNLEAVKNEIRAFKARIDSRYGESESDQVYQLNMQFFPHTN
jgi:uncharacterized protein (TIGR02147 family)